MQVIRPDYAAYLSQVPLFARLSPREIQVLATRVRHRTYKAGEVIFHKDDPGHTFYIIVDGLVKIYLESEEGQEAVLIILKSSEFFGELSLLDGAPRSATAAAMEPTETYAIDREEFLGFIREHPEAALSIFAVIAFRLRRADGIIADAAFLDLPSRVAKKLLELANKFGRASDHQIEIDIRLRQQDFAGMVSATRESVNRTLTSLEEEGIIRIERQRITILRPDRLQARIP
ncbi:MAG: Crp/Fnr family transcriptional regulator [Chloroflexi bacterium]|nr:Crp/Fnr family transcriptional regulator [Chloroflexota bacterium]